jgi:hypothetical protein
MKNFLATCIITLVCNLLIAQDSLVVTLNKVSVKNGDSLIFEAVLHNYTTYTSASTLNVELQHLITKKKYNYRFFLLNGYLRGTLLVGKNIELGNYALHAKVQSSVFRFKGKITDGFDKKEKYEFVLYNDSNKVISQPLVTDEDGRFKIPKTVIQGNCYMFFKGKSLKKNRYLKVYLDNVLDSAYDAVDSVTNYFVITDLPSIKKPDPTQISNYKYWLTNNNPKEILDEVIVTAIKKDQRKKYEEQFVSPLYTGGEDQILDGFNSDIFSSAGDLLTILATNIRGLTIETDSDGNQLLYRRNVPVNIMVDEISVDPAMVWTISPADVAMVKSFGIGSGVSNIAINTGGMGLNTGGGGGLVVIYTKRGSFLPESRRASFKINGYSLATTKWE